MAKIVIVTCNICRTEISIRLEGNQNLERQLHKQGWHLRHNQATCGRCSAQRKRPFNE